MSLLALIAFLVLALWTYMSLWFVAARVLGRADIVDTAWGLGFVYVAWLAWLLADRQVDLKLFAVSLVTLWGLRLSLHITQRNMHKSEDYRYVRYRQQWGASFWPKVYLRIFLVQGLLLLIISVPIISLVDASHHAWISLAALGFTLWCAGIIIEAEADSQLRAFTNTKKPGQIMMNGLWKYSRHPNYFGEVTVWWGAALVAVSYQQYVGIIGAVVITLLITKVSGIPPLEKHYQDNKAYQRYAQITSILIPRFPRR